MINLDFIFLFESVIRYLNIIQGVYSMVLYGKEVNRVCIVDDIFEEMVDYNIII